MSALAWLSGFITCWSIMTDSKHWMVVGFVGTVLFAFMDYAKSISDKENIHG